jgi:hypothetical protein
MLHHLMVLTHLAGLVSANCGSTGLIAICGTAGSSGSSIDSAFSLCLSFMHGVQAALRGSFIAKQSGNHVFEPTADTGVFDSETFIAINGASTSWTWDMSSSNSFSGSITYPYSCIREYRYPLLLESEGALLSVTQLTISVQYPDAPQSVLLAGENCETCYEKGCRDTTVSRDPFQCVRTSPLPPASARPSLTLTQFASPHGTIAQTASASASATASATASVSQSRPFLATQSVVETSPDDRSDSPFPSRAFTPSLTNCPSGVVDPNTTRRFVLSNVFLTSQHGLSSQFTSGRFISMQSIVDTSGHDRSDFPFHSLNLCSSILTATRQFVLSNAFHASQHGMSSQFTSGRFVSMQSIVDSSRNDRSDLLFHSLNNCSSVLTATRQFVLSNAVLESLGQQGISSQFTSAREGRKSEQTRHVTIAMSTSESFAFKESSLVKVEFSTDASAVVFDSSTADGQSLALPIGLAIGALFVLLLSLGLLLWRLRKRDYSVQSCPEMTSRPFSFGDEGEVTQYNPDLLTAWENVFTETIDRPGSISMIE